MKTTTLVDISTKSNWNEQTSCQRSGWVTPFLLLRLSRILAIRPTCEISRALGLLELIVSSVHPGPQILEGAPGTTLHFPPLVVMRPYNLKVVAADLMPPLELADSFRSHLMWKPSGMSFISPRTYINEDTALDKHHFKMLLLNYWREKNPAEKNGIAWVTLPATLFHPICSLLLPKLSKSLESVGSDPPGPKQ